MVIAFLPCCTFNIFWLPDMRPPVALGKGPGESCRIIQQKPFILQFSLFFNLKNGWEIFKIGLCFLRKPISLSDQVGVVFWVYLLLELHSGPFSNHSPENFQKCVLLDHGVVDPYVKIKISSKIREIAVAMSLNENKFNILTSFFD